MRSRYPATVVMRSRYPVAVLLLLLAALLGVASAGTAAAHSSLKSSVPAEGAQLSAGPPEVVLTFNEPMQEQFAVLTVVGPDGNFWQDGKATVDGPRLSVVLRPLGPVGTYTVNYRITSADGHPVEGQRRFTLTVAGTGTPGASASDESDSGNGVPVWPFVVGAVVVIGTGVGAMVAMSRRRRS
ncbi:copper resistance protein CopC [Gordonia sp. (in: high G+C Gram-positive bacteria)]|jgi:methionine-rich copper-binding protein CopC|uniref:copper resistance CopC family protein n=1 Tax=Gordonia sp. (in: high G+C Gram-positive bacteria) TaxID=84139 RepID=UPI0025BD1140|nr:copper resistance protein CopC [Gordonia sp. (in: high G+C Gram-positive bacteria)]HMS76404.1 copper resistance protein CopC [Gordonia sp. (in: high G+C Gram-positive bacteria)]